MSVIIRNGREYRGFEAARTWTQTYSTAAATIPAAVANLTAATAVSGKTASSKIADTTTTISNAILLTNMKSFQTKVNAINADVLAIKKAVTAIIDDMQALGLAR